MIFLATKNEALVNYLNIHLRKLGFDLFLAKREQKDHLSKMYKPEVSAIIADEYFFDIPKEANTDILNSISERIPVIILRDGPPVKKSDKYSSLNRTSDQITILSCEERESILASVSIFCGHQKSGLKNLCRSIPYYSPFLPISRLRENGGLGIITIDASSFSKIGLEYGTEVYNQVKLVLKDVLYEMWGKIGNFRETDILCQKSQGSNVFYIFLSHSRETGSLPLPGALERLADRLSGKIQNRLLNELFAPKSCRRIPDCIQSIPVVVVGFFGVLNNPCIDARELIEEGLEASRRMAEDQLVRVKERQRELMQTLIQSKDLLFPNYQGVFKLSGITKRMVDQAKNAGSIFPLKDYIFGFESLIRIDQAASRRYMTEGIIGLDPKYLYPDVLFAIANDTKISLELDQTCLRLAAAHSSQLPGVLMVNILPRNLYYIDRIEHFFQNRKDLMFEVSEAEAINNFELMLESCFKLKQKNIGIAADDFGKGYSSLERILKMKPQVIKFDRSIIENIHEDPIKQAYVRGMVAASKYLKTTMLAEGVERWEEAQVLQQMGIELVQGYLFHRPEPVAKILTQLYEAELKTVA